MKCIDNGSSERLLAVLTLIDLPAGYFAYDAVRLTYRFELASLAGNSPDLALTLTISVLTSIGRLLTPDSSIP